MRISRPRDRPMPIPPALPFYAAVNAPAPPRIVQVRVAYQSPVTKSAYPVNQERVRVFVLIWVTGEAEPYSFESMKNDGRVPIWMTGTEGVGIAGAKMVYTERGAFGDGKDEQGRYLPERLPVKTWAFAGRGESGGFANVRAWPQNWARPTVAWYRVRHRIATQQAQSFGAQKRSFRMDRESMGGWRDKLGIQTILERGVHRYVAVVKSGTQTVSTVDNPQKTWFSGNSFNDAWATRIAVRDSATTNDPFLQYASLFLGTPYSYGGFGYGGATGNDNGLSFQHGMDCSGLVTAAFFHARYKYEKGIRRGERTSTSAMGSGGGSVPTISINKSKLAPGDLMNYAGAHVRIVWQYTPGRDTFFGIEEAPPEVHIKSFPVYDAKYKARHIPLRDTNDYKQKALLAALETIIGSNFNPGEGDVVTKPIDVRPDVPGTSNTGDGAPVTDTPASDGIDVRIFVNGAPLTLPFAPVTKSGAIQIALRPVLDSAGFKTEWFSEGNGASATTGLIAVKGTSDAYKSVDVTVKQKAAFVNDKKVTLLVAPYWNEKQVVASTAIFKKLGWTVTLVERKLYIRTQ